MACVVSTTMATTQETESHGETRLEYIHNEDDGTLTIVADREPDSIVPPTEWITASTDVTVSVAEYR
jgi:hypothetical protein